MKDEKKVVAMDDVVETTADIDEETKDEGVLSKAYAGLKKHGKAVAVFAACTVGGFIGYALGSKHNSNDSDVIDVDEVPRIEATDDSASDEVTEG